jgi:hypothetical protein
MLSAPCCKNLWHVKEPCRYVNRYLVGKNSAISHQVSPALLSDVSSGYCQRALVDESGMIRTLDGENRTDMVAVHGTPCAIPPRNSNSNPMRALGVVFDD